MRAIALFLAASALWGQVDGVTTSVSRTLSLPADEARFRVDVAAPFRTSSNQVLEILGGAGIRPADLTAEELSDGYGILGPNLEVQPVYSLFTFDFIRAGGDTKPTIDRLAAIERTLPDDFTMVYRVTLAPSERSIAALKSIVQPQLVVEARRKAQTLADAAGLVLGPVESVSAVKRLRSSQAVIFDPYTERGGGPVELSPVTSIRLYFISRERPGVEDADTVDGFRATYTVTVRFGAH